MGNLFDTVDDPISDDFGFSPENGWTEAVKDAKIANLASIIDAMFDGAGPDLMGVCEVENESVLQQLVDALAIRDDLVVLALNDGPDIRGIDCGLIYSSRIFEPTVILPPEPPSPLGHLVHNRYPTRDILEVPLRIKENGSELIVYVNHWPSRMRGHYETEPLRIATANHLGRLIDQRLKFSRQQFLEFVDNEASMNMVQKRWNRNILAMGDFNDEPFSRSVLEELKASNGLDRLEEKVKKSRDRNYLPEVASYAKLQASLFNCMWPIVAIPDRGSYFFRMNIPSFSMLDQFIVSRGLYYGLSGLKMKRLKHCKPSVLDQIASLNTESDMVWADIFDPDAMVTSLNTRMPKRFSFDNKNGLDTHNAGFSDHFPIVTTMLLV